MQAWGFLMGRRFSQNGVLCICVDYRNYPQSRVVGMLEDVRDALIWTKANVASYGGDPDRIWLIGQVAFPSSSASAPPHCHNCKSYFFSAIFALIFIHVMK